eukprot:Nitzschia sp. Nitz4//scaffold483_size5322//2345//5042//NITZ4_009227-RA/size5322-augustus-gene-0.2-mRNA-1//-1//CDS//3329552882//1191//frame0
MTERNTGKKNRYHRYKKQKPKFEGKEESLKGYIFDYSGSKNPDQWIKTSKEIRGFVGRTATKFNKELTTAVKELELTDPNPPVRPNGTNPFDIHEYGQRFKDHQALLQVISDFRSKLYAVVMGQCTPAMEAHLRSHEDFEDAENDGIAILKMIKNILHTFEDKREPAEALLEVKEEFYGMKQGSSSLEDYYEHFKAQVEVMKMVGVDVVDPSLVVAIAKARDPRAEPSAQDRTAAYNKTLAEYDTPIAGLDNDGVAFVNDGTTMVLTPGKDGKSYGHVECHNCGKKGHYSKQCPDVDGNDEGGESECQRTVSQVGELEGYGTVWRDIMIAEDIFGPDIGSLKGKTVRGRPHRVPQGTVEHPNIPRQMYEHYRDVTICGDVMHVNGVPMLVTISRNIRFTTVSALKNLKTKTIVKALKEIVRVYRLGGFRVRTMLVDGAFESTRGDMAAIGIRVNPTSMDEHVGEVERQIRTVKERMRAAYNMLPFEYLPPRLIIELAKSAVFWLNAFPHKLGISEQLSPRAIITGEGIDFNRHCEYEFGEYVQTHEEHSNNMDPRTAGALALRPTGNRQGGYYFYNIKTGRVVNRATKMPMPNEVIEHVNKIGKQTKGKQGLKFSDRQDLPIMTGGVLDVDLHVDDDDDDDSDYSSDEDGFSVEDDVTLVYDEDGDDDEEGDEHIDHREVQENV